MIDYYLLKAVYEGDHIIRLLFRNGKSGVLDFKKYFGKVKAYDKFISNTDYFKNFYIMDGYSCWGEGEIDIAPETLYHDSTDEPYPEYLEV